MSTLNSQTAFVFGSHPSCFFTALKLQNQGFKVTIFDSGESLAKGQFTDFDVNFWENTERTKECLGLLNELLDTQIDFTEVDSTPLMLSGDKVSDFVGFGDKKYSSLPAISELNRRAQLQIGTAPEQIFQLAFERFTGEIKSYSQLTQIQFATDTIEGVQINSGKLKTADAFAFCQSPSELLDIFPDEVLSGRMRTKVARTEVFGRLSLRIQFDEIADEIKHFANMNTFMIPHAADYEPCMGGVTETRGLWHSFINTEFSEDPEKLAGQVRHMRKLIQKALPVLEAPLKTAAISFEKEDFATYESELVLTNLLKNNRNMFCTSPMWSDHWGIAGALDALMMNFELQGDVVTAVTSDTESATPSSLEASI